jgi:hypothetical protein
MDMIMRAELGQADEPSGTQRARDAGADHETDDDES